jgi:hypothetical protein
MINSVSAESRSERSTRDVASVAYPIAAKVVEHFARQFEGKLSFELVGDVVKVRPICPDARIRLRTVEPIRPQLVKELRRLASLFETLSWYVSDTIWSGEEEEWDFSNEDWTKFVGSR